MKKKPGKKSQPEVVILSEAEKKDLIARIESGRLSGEDRKLVIGIVQAMHWMSVMFQYKKLSLGKVKRIFGFKSEKRSSASDKNSEGPDDSSGGDSPASIDASKTSAKPEEASPPPVPPPKGHGRNSSDVYCVSETVVHHLLPEFTAGAACPSCLQGRLYDLDAGVTIKIEGQPLFKAVRHEQQRLRCALCGETFRASLPKDIPKDKLDGRGQALLAILRYGVGLPNYRLAKLQEQLGVPLPAASQWDYLEKAAGPCYPVYRELIAEAAQGDLVYNDDTRMRVILLRQGLEESGDERLGIFTSAVQSVLTCGQKISLFFTGNRHAGENLARVFSARQSSDVPLQMCDALAANSKDVDSVLLNCLDHARRQFVHLESSFPGEVAYILDQLGKVYLHDKLAKKWYLDGFERLQFHRERSQPIMEHLQIWLEQQLAGGKVEENSPLGDAILYMLKRWQHFCGFFQYVDAPLSNAACERQLKTAICHRKNSLFYRSITGAIVGDVMMSLIQTCKTSGVNPLAYLTAIITNDTTVRKDPGAWLPWNYTDALATIQ